MFLKCQGAATASVDTAKFFICNSLCPKTNGATDKETNDACRQLNECDGPSTQEQPAPAATTAATAGPKASVNSTFNPFEGDYGDYVQDAES